jgi:predicted O-methyltransferase YrrM
MLTWKEDDRFVIGETTFLALPPDSLEQGAHQREGEFFVFKPRPLVERHAALIDELEPKQIFELGVYQGGSAVFFAELAQPRRLVGIDRKRLTEVRERVEGYAAGRGLHDVIRMFGEVDQADRRTLAKICEESFDGATLDLVVDDCSHLYEPTRASFNELFPRLRPGGAYVIEDWPWAHPSLEDEPSEGFFPDEVPLTRLLFEIVLAVPRVTGLITDISIDFGAAVVRRGSTRVDPATFDISTCSDPRGQALLTPPERVAANLTALQDAL